MPVVPPNRREGLAALALLALLALAARAQTFGNPVLGFDEQFYLLVGDRMLHGAVPYVDIFDRKPIGLFLIYAMVRSLGGGGFLQYKLAATCVVVATAWCVFRLARLRAGAFGAVAAAGTYVLWLDFMEGEGGQSPVFYNLLMVTAAGAILFVVDRTGRTRAAGMAAMAAAGIAIQIKYSVAIEGVYLGCVLLWLARRDGEPMTRVAGSAVLWIGCATTPTGAALAWFAMHGHAREFLFCNFASVLGQIPRPLPAEMTGLAVLVGILALPLAGVAIARPWRAGDVATRIAVGWLLAAMGAVLAYGRFDSPHYGMPILLPATILLAPALDGSRRRRAAVLAALGFAWVGGQTVLTLSERAKGGRTAATAVAAAAMSGPAPGCIYVYDGYPALYMLTGSCLPTRWPFPGHLSTRDEASAAAIGVDPVAEIRRILRTSPTAIVDDSPRFAFGNPATREVLERALSRDYRLVACIRTGPKRLRLVYRLNASRIAAAPACRLAQHQPDELVSVAANRDDQLFARRHRLNLASSPAPAHARAGFGNHPQLDR